jgi:hypothetical protein
MLSFTRKPVAGGDFGPQDGAWSLFEGGSRKEPMSVRRNHALAPYAGRPEYDRILLIQVPIAGADKRGLPAATDFPYLDALEDALVEALGAGDESLLAAVITRAGHRRFLFYTRDDTAARQKAETVVDASGVADVACGVVPDPGWEKYSHFLALR